MATTRSDDTVATDRPLDAGDGQLSALLRRQLSEHVCVARAVEGLVADLEVVARVLCEAFAAGGTVYTFGNGGSAADAQHLTGELIGRYRRERRPLPAVTLSTDATVVTCIANDYSFDEVLARQVTALAGPGDVVAAFTTSGRSPNVVAGLAAAQRVGATTLLFAGADAGPAGEFADHVLHAPSTVTPRVQEMHTLLLHVISEAVDVWAAGSCTT